MSESQKTSVEENVAEKVSQKIDIEPGRSGEETEVGQLDESATSGTDQETTLDESGVYTMTDLMKEQEENEFEAMVIYFCSASPNMEPDLLISFLYLYYRLCWVDLMKIIAPTSR